MNATIIIETDDGVFRASDDLKELIGDLQKVAAGAKFGWGQYPNLHAAGAIEDLNTDCPYCPQVAD